MAWCGRVRLGQPYVQGREASLGSKTGHGQHKQSREQAGAGIALRLFKHPRKHSPTLQGVKRSVARDLPQQGKEGHEGHSAQVGSHKVDP